MVRKNHSSLRKQRPVIVALNARSEVTNIVSRSAKMELRHIQEMQELRSSLEKQEYFTFSQAARLMGVSRQYIYKLVKEDKLRASRISGRMALQGVQT